MKLTNSADPSGPAAPLSNVNLTSLGGKVVAVMELHALAQMERIAQPVIGYAPAFRQSRRYRPVRLQKRQAVVHIAQHQVVVARAALVGQRVEVVGFAGCSQNDRSPVIGVPAARVASGQRQRQHSRQQQRQYSLYTHDSHGRSPCLRWAARFAYRQSPAPAPHWHCSAYAHACVSARLRASCVGHKNFYINKIIQRPGCDCQQDELQKTALLYSATAYRKIQPNTIMRQYRMPSCIASMRVALADKLTGIAPMSVACGIGFTHIMMQLTI